jgi:hypothetical protein
MRGSPSLRAQVPDTIAEELSDARRLALLDLAEFAEQPTTDLHSLIFTEDQVLGPWLPD